MLSQLDPPSPKGHNFQLADVLDNPDHHAWAAAGDAKEDAQLVWSVLRYGSEYA
jgi:hypothetical protein